MNFGLGVLLALSASVPENFSKMVRARRVVDRNCPVCRYPADHTAYSSLECEIVCKNDGEHTCRVKVI